MSISILASQASEFATAIQTKLGKGRIHAELLYEEFFRSGTLTGQHAAFNNARELHKNIIENIHVAFPTLIEGKHDGATGKMLLKTPDQLEIESVLIPMQFGGTLCISSQVGCRMGCQFCETGRMGLLRNLTVEEIVSQVHIARHQVGFNFRNIVFMGMGEPFDNYDVVMKAVKILNDSKGFGFGRRHISISTSGCIEGIQRLALEGEHAPNLAVSINAPIDELRNKLMPINRKHNLAALYETMKNYCLQTEREILIAYVLIKDQNALPAHAEALANYLHGLNVKVNLIPYNPQSSDRFQPPEADCIETFAKILREKGYYTLLRHTKGQNIMAACGQLGNIDLRKLTRMSRIRDDM